MTDSISVDSPDFKTLTPDEHAVALRELRELTFGFGHLVKALQEGNTLDVELTRNILKVGEYRVADFAKRLGIATHTAAELDERHRELRAANLRVHALERQLGAQAQGPVMQAGMQAIGERLNHWWDEFGFGYISELQFSQYGNLEATFSCRPTGRWRLTGSDTPVSDKEAFAQWVTVLQARGYVMTGQNEDQLGVVDCDASRRTLTALFTDQFPAARVREIVSQAASWKEPSLVLRSVKVLFKNLDELLTLPAAPAFD